MQTVSRRAYILLTLGPKWGKKQRCFNEDFTARVPLARGVFSKTTKIRKDTRNLKEKT